MVFGSICMVFLQCPMVAEQLRCPSKILIATVVPMYVVTLLLMGWVAFADPGQIETEGEELPIAAVGLATDAFLVVVAYRKRLVVEVVVLLLHGAYSAILLHHGGGIFRIHVGLVTRNEVVQEWKTHKHCVAHNTSKGDNVRVENLSDSDEYNDHFDRGLFIYSPEENEFDRGWASNWREGGLLTIRQDVSIGS